jgi:hypothetical protein
MNLIFIWTVVGLYALYILRYLIVHSIRLKELKRLTVLADAGIRITEQLDYFGQTSIFRQMVDIRKWTHNQFFGK